MNRLLSSIPTAFTFSFIVLVASFSQCTITSVQADQNNPPQTPRFEQPYTLPKDVDGLVLSDNSKYAAYFDKQANVIVLNLPTQKVLWKHVETSWEYGSLAVSSNGLYLAGNGSEWSQHGLKGERLNMTYIVNTRTKKVIRILGYAKSLAFSPDSKTIIVAGEKLTTYDVRTGHKIQVLWKHRMTDFMDSQSMKFSPNKQFLAVGSSGGDSDGHVRVWDFNNSKLLHDFTNAYSPIVFSPNSKLLATSADDPHPVPDGLPPGSYTESARFAFQDFAVKVWSLTNGNVEVLKHPGRQVEGTADPQAFSLNGQLLLTTNGDLWDVKTLQFIEQRQKLKGQGKIIRFSRSGAFIIATIAHKN